MIAISSSSVRWTQPQPDGSTRTLVLDPYMVSTPQMAARYAHFSTLLLAGCLMTNDKHVAKWAAELGAEEFSREVE